MTNKKKTKKRKLKFSERLITIILVYSMSVFERALIFAFINKSENLFAYLLPIIGTLITSGVLIFQWKEKNENINKQNLNPEYVQMEQQYINVLPSSIPRNEILSEDLFSVIDENVEDLSGN